MNDDVIMGEENESFNEETEEGLSDPPPLLLPVGRRQKWLPLAQYNHTEHRVDALTAGCMRPGTEAVNCRTRQSVKAFMRGVRDLSKFLPRVWSYGFDEDGWIAIRGSNTVSLPLEIPVAIGKRIRIESTDTLFRLEYSNSCLCSRDDKESTVVQAPEKENEGVHKPKEAPKICEHCSWGALLRKECKNANCEHLTGCDDPAQVLRCILLQHIGDVIPKYMLPVRKQQGKKRRQWLHELGAPSKAGILLNMRFAVEFVCGFPCRGRANGICGCSVYVGGKAGETDKLYVVEDSSQNHEHTAAPCGPHRCLDCSICIDAGALPLAACAGNLSIGPFGFFQILKAQEELQTWNADFRSPEMIRQALCSDNDKVDETILYGNLVLTGAGLVDVNNNLAALKRGLGGSHASQVPTELKHADKESKMSYLLQEIARKHQYVDPFTKSRGCLGPIVNLQTYPFLYLRYFSWKRALLWKTLAEMPLECNFGLFVDATGCIFDGQWNNRDILLVQLTTPHPSVAAAAVTSSIRPHGPMQLCQAAITDRSQSGFDVIFRDCDNNVLATCGRDHPIPRWPFMVGDFDLAMMNSYSCTTNGMSFSQLCEHVHKVLDQFTEICKDKEPGYAATRQGRDEFITLAKVSFVFPCGGHYLRAIKSLGKYGAAFKGSKNSKFYEHILMLIYVRLLQSPVFCGIENWVALKQTCKDLKELFACATHVDLELPLDGPVWLVKDFACFRAPTESDNRVGKPTPIVVFEVIKFKQVWLHVNVYEGLVVENSDFSSETCAEHEGMYCEVSSTPAEETLLRANSALDDLKPEQVRETTDEKMCEASVSDIQEVTLPVVAPLTTCTRIRVPTSYERKVRKSVDRPLLTDLQYREGHLCMVGPLIRAIFPGMQSRCNTNAYVELTIRKHKHHQMNNNLRQPINVWAESMCKQDNSEVTEFLVAWDALCSTPLTPHMLGGLKRGAAKQQQNVSKEVEKCETALALAKAKENRLHEQELEYRGTAAQLQPDLSFTTDEADSSMQIFDPESTFDQSVWGPKRQKRTIETAVQGLSPSLHTKVHSLALPLLQQPAATQVLVPCGRCSVSKKPGDKGIRYMAKTCSNNCCKMCCSAVVGQCKAASHKKALTSANNGATPVLSLAEGDMTACSNNSVLNAPAETAVASAAYVPPSVRSAQV